MPATMTDAMYDRLMAMTDAELEKLNRDSIRTLRQAWLNRHTSFRTRQVIRTNITMIRNLRAVAPW